MCHHGLAAASFFISQKPLLFKSGQGTQGGPVYLVSVPEFLGTGQGHLCFSSSVTLRTWANLSSLVIVIWTIVNFSLPTVGQVFLLLFSKDLLIYVMHMSTPPLLSLDTPEEGIGSHYRWLWDTMWLLGIELKTSRRIVSVLNCWAISPALSSMFVLSVCFSVFFRSPSCFFQTYYVAEDNLKSLILLPAPSTSWDVHHHGLYVSPVLLVGLDRHLCSHTIDYRLLLDQSLSLFIPSSQYLLVFLGQSTSLPAVPFLLLCCVTLPHSPMSPSTAALITAVITVFQGHKWASKGLTNSREGYSTYFLNETIMKAEILQWEKGEGNQLLLSTHNRPSTFYTSMPFPALTILLAIRSKRLPLSASWEQGQLQIH